MHDTRHMVVPGVQLKLQELAEAQYYQDCVQKRLVVRGGVTMNRFKRLREQWSYWARCADCGGQVFK